MSEMTEELPTPTLTTVEDDIATPSANSSGAENRTPDRVDDKSSVVENCGATNGKRAHNDEITLDDDEDEDDCQTIDDEEEEDDDNSKPPPVKRVKPDENGDDDVQCVGDNMDEVKRAEKERQLKRALSFISRFAETVEKSSKPVCAVDDLRLTDVFSRFVEYQCSGNIAATIDVIKSTHVRFPSHVSVPPSQVVGLLAQYEGAQSVRQLKTSIFGHATVAMSDTERKDKQYCRTTLVDRAPSFAYCAYSLGLDLVQEKVYSDVVDGKHMSFFAKSAEQYASVCEQLTPIVNALRERNLPFKTEVEHACGRCRFKAVSAFMIHEHRRTSHTTKNGIYMCAVCDFKSESKESTVLMEHLRDVHKLEMIEGEVDETIKYPCPCCEEGFRWKGELVDHLRACKREERTRIIRYRLNKAHLPLVSQASKMPLIPGEAPLAGECSMPNGQAATLCVQLGGPDGAFALIKRPLPVDPSRQQYGVRRSTIMGVPNNTKFGGMATNQLQQQVARQRQLQAMAQQGMGKAKNAPMFSNVNGGSAMGQTTAFSGGATMAQVRHAAARSGAESQSQHNPEQNQQLYMMTYPCEICDNQLIGLIRYLRHMQTIHQQLKRKTSTDLMSGPPLSCSRCRERFYTYEGLERHLALDHSLVTGDLLAKAKNRSDAGRCKICAKMYAFNFLQHLVTEHKVTLRSAEIDYTCDVCEFSCASYNQLDLHITNTHPVNAKPVLPSIGRQKVETVRRMVNTQAPSKPPGKKSGSMRYTCTPCSLKFDEYKQVIAHWQDRHLKKSHVSVCRIDECSVHRSQVEEDDPSLDVDWEVPENTDGWVEGDAVPEEVTKTRPCPLSVKAKAIITLDD